MDFYICVLCVINQNQMGYQINCNFKEKLIEIDISRFLGSYTPSIGKFYYLEDADEQLTGADLISKDDNLLPIYMQVKVSQGLKTISTYPASNRKNRSYLEDIREFRDNLGLDNYDQHFLYFKLRKKAKNAVDFQHNILMNYANTGFSHASYVAPLILRKKDYEKELLDPHIPHRPFYFHQYELKDPNWSSYFGFVPFLRSHISIIPHQRIDTHEHYYAYSKHGTDVTWHSPEFLSDKPSRLSDMLVRVVKDFYYQKERETVRSIAIKLMSMPIMENRKLETDKPIDIIQEHGRILEKEYGIRQLLFTLRKLK